MVQFQKREERISGRTINMRVKPFFTLILSHYVMLAVSQHYQILLKLTEMSHKTNNK